MELLGFNTCVVWCAVLSKLAAGFLVLTGDSEKCASVYVNHDLGINNAQCNPIDSGRDKGRYYALFFNDEDSTFSLKRYAAYADCENFEDKDAAVLFDRLPLDAKACVASPADPAVYYKIITVPSYSYTFFSDKQCEAPLAAYNNLSAPLLTCTALTATRALSFHAQDLSKAPAAEIFAGTACNASDGVKVLDAGRGGACVPESGLARALAIPGAKAYKIAYKSVHGEPGPAGFAVQGSMMMALPASYGLHLALAAAALARAF